MAARSRVLLVGGGHAHVQLLRRWVMAPLPADVTVVVDQPVAVYSGMVPAWIAGELPRHALEIDVRPLARRAGARLIVAAAEGVDPVARRVHLSGRPPVEYDVVSFDIGSTVAHRDLPGVAAHAVPSRPISGLLDALERRLGAVGTGALRVVVVGAGAGGVEVAACLEARLRRLGATPAVTLLSATTGSVGGNVALLRAVDEALRDRGIARETGRAVAVEAAGVRLEDGRVLPSDLTVWVTGAAAHGVLGALPTDARGFVRVRDTLQVVDHDRVFAAGDCAVPDGHPWVPRAGVYAVRQGPVLARNVEALLDGRALERWRPQRDFLSMLHLGDGTAIVGKWGRAAHGRWVWRWKDRIDRAFMERFQVLGPDGEPDTAFGRWFPPMDDPGPCGGCAAKVGPAALDRLLGTLGARPVAETGAPDLARVDLGGVDVLASVDAFPAFTDDPWLVGRIAARNALSDLLVHGAQPSAALAIATAPEGGRGAADLAEAMAGASAVLAGAGCALVGGHSTVGAKLQLGFAVLGLPGPAPWGAGPAEVGDALVLLGALGTGVLWRADMLGLARGPWIAAASGAMDADPRRWSRALAGVPVRAATDVTGFGLAGHAATLVGERCAVLRASAVPALPGARALLARGLRSTADPANRDRPDVVVRAGVSAADAALAFDPATSVAWLLAVAPDAVAEVRARLGGEAVVVGEVRQGGAGIRVEVAGG